MKIRRIPLMTAVAVVFALLLSACAVAAQPSSKGPTVAFQMHWSWSPSTAGFAVAKEQGLFDKQGVDATLTEGKGSGTAVQLVTTGKANMGIADAVAVAQEVQKGAPLVVVATINQVTNTAMQVLNSSGIKTVKDLKGKTVAVPPGGAYSFLFPLFLQLNGLTEQDVKIANMPFESMVPSLIAGKVDAIVGGQDSHVSLTAQGAQFTDFPFGDYGVNAVAHSIFTTKSYAEKNPTIVKKVVAASLDGWSYARSHPDEALADIKKLQPDTVLNNAREELKVLLPLLCAGGAKYIGLAEQDRWKNSLALLGRAKLISNAPDPATFVSYDYLPPQSSLTSCS